MFNNNCVHYETVPRWKWIARGDERRVREEEDVAVFLMAKKTCRPGKTGATDPSPLSARQALPFKNPSASDEHTLYPFYGKPLYRVFIKFLYMQYCLWCKRITTFGDEMRNVHKSFWFLINLWCILSWCSWTVIGAGKQESSYPFDLCQVHQPACTKIFAKCRNRHKSTWRIILHVFLVHISHF